MALFDTYINNGIFIYQKQLKYINIIINLINYIYKPIYIYMLSSLHLTGQPWSPSYISSTPKHQASEPTGAPTRKGAFGDTRRKHQNEAPEDGMIPLTLGFLFKYLFELGIVV